ATGDAFRGLEPQHRIGSLVRSRRDTDIDHIRHPGIATQQLPDLVLQRHTRVVSGNHYPHQFRSFPLFRVVFDSSRTSSIAVTNSANETPPGSGDPALRSASRAARPLFGTSSAVAVAASVAARAAAHHAWPTDAPLVASARSVVRNGSIASSMVLSPTWAPPSSVNASAAAATASAIVVAVGAPPPRRIPAPVSASNTPYRAPLAPPAASAKAVPAASNAAPSASPRAARSTSRAAATAARIPLLIPMPWSPSAATASNLPSSAALRSIVAIPAVSKASASPAGSVPVVTSIVVSGVDTTGVVVYRAPELRYAGVSQGAAYSWASSSSST